MSPLISVIVPVYNAVKYLRDCIESIINQTYCNWELILVDDQSTDNSLMVCREYAQKDSRIRIVEIRHQGVVHARISGVKESKGEYCMFVDSDDWVAGNLIESVFELVLCGADIINYTLESVYDTRENEWKNLIPEGIYEGERLETLYKRMMFDFQYNSPGIIQSLCTKMIKRDLLWKIIVAVDCRITMGEDAAVTYPVMLCAKKIAVTNKCLYYYRVHSGSMCTSKNLNIFSEIYYFQQYMKTVFSAYDNSYCLMEQLTAYMYHFIEKGMRDVFSLRLGNIYAIPFYKLPNMCGRIVLYGAGVVGQSYYRQLVQIDEIDIVAWIDKKEKQVVFGRSTDDLNILKEIQFDKILIAVKSAAVAQEIENELLQFVSIDQIVWAEPQTGGLKKAIEGCMELIP